MTISKCVRRETWLWMWKKRLITSPKLVVVVLWYQIPLTCTQTLWPCCQQQSPFSTQLDKRKERHFLWKHTIGRANLAPFGNEIIVWPSTITPCHLRFRWCDEWHFFTSDATPQLTCVMDGSYERFCNYSFVLLSRNSVFMPNYGVDSYLKKQEKLGTKFLCQYSLKLLQL